MKYLIFETEMSAQTRSAQEAVNRGSDDTDVTQYWWVWRETVEGEWALCIPISEVSVLTEQEQDALVDEPEWPVVSDV